MKLSKSQLEVLKLMNEEWELLKDRDANGHVYLSKRGKDFEIKRVNVATWFRLYKLGLINTSPEMQFPTEYWFLTEKGKTELALINQMERERQSEYGEYK